MPTLTFAPSKRPLRVRRRVHREAQTWSDACCPSGGGISRSYALTNSGTSDAVITGLVFALAVAVRSFTGRERR
jgi:hypothetical protein